MFPIDLGSSRVTVIFKINQTFLFSIFLHIFRNLQKIQKLTSWPTRSLMLKSVSFTFHLNQCILFSARWKLKIFLTTSICTLIKTTQWKEQRVMDHQSWLLIWSCPGAAHSGNTHEDQTRYTGPGPGNVSIPVSVASSEALQARLLDFQRQLQLCGPHSRNPPKLMMYPKYCFHAVAHHCFDINNLLLENNTKD